MDNHYDRKLNQKKSEQILQGLVKQVESEPKNAQNYYNLGAMLIEVKSYEQAEELFVKALGLFQDADDETKDTLTYGLGNVYYSSGKLEAAISEFKKIKTKKLLKDTYLMIAQSYVTLGNNKQALAFALTALNEDNQDTDTLRLVAESLLALGNFDEAARYYDQVLEINPKDGKTAFDRGLVAMVLTEPFDDYFEKARELDPGYFKKQQEKLEGIEKLLNSQRQQDED